MSDTSALLVLVPARGGSRGIPRKVLQPVAGVPLLLRTLETARRAGVTDRIVVSTDDAGIAAVARLHGYEVLDRPQRFATDQSTIADVVKHAVEALDWVGRVLVMQPTCPLLRPATVKSFVEYASGLAFDWAISGYRPGHLYWQHGSPLSPRENRQKAATSARAVWQESGALQFMTAAHALHGDGLRTMLEIPAGEALDIDTLGDLRAAELALGRKTIGFRVAVGDQVGTGHFWRCLQLSDALSHHDVWWWFTGEAPKWATALLDQRGIPWHGWTVTPDLVVVDALDAAEAIVPHTKGLGAKVVLFEHDGPATKFADLVVDEFADPKWAVLRPEFLCLPERPDRDFLNRSRREPRVLVTFGGTDPSGLARRFAPILFGRVRVVQGPGAAPLSEMDHVEVVQGACMAEQMRWADIVLTSQGRTVSEAAACGVPVLSIAANERESRHVRIPGVLYFGLHALVSDSHLAATFARLTASPGLLAEMARTARAQVDGLGVRRIVRRIEDLVEGL